MDEPEILDRPVTVDSSEAVVSGGTFKFIV